MPFQMIRNNITNIKADAIVNTANPNPVIGGGTDSAIYQVAGERRLSVARKKIGVIARGDAVHTPAYRLKAKYIIHTVGPRWVDGSHGERDILHSCYRKSLALAAELSCKSIAFPLIATGVYGFPKDEALQIALSEINQFLLTHDMNVILVVFDRSSFELSGKLVDNIKQFIDEHEVDQTREAEYDRNFSRGNYPLKMRREANFEVSAPVTGQTYGGASSFDFKSTGRKSLEDLLNTKEDTFQQRLFRLIDERGMDDVTVYKKANIDRKVFSKIRSNVDYHPKKKTAVAFAVALQLDMDEMQDLLSRAEIAFSPSNKFDLIITYFITHQIYDIYEINSTLFQYDQPILG